MNIAPETSAPARGENAQLRGDETRLRIIEIAVALFGAAGYDGTPTRRIAAEAKVNLAAIPYYFGDKAGLYKAALEHVIVHLDGIFSPVAQRVTDGLAQLAASADRENIFALLFELFDHWSDVHLGFGRTALDKNWRDLMTRAELEPPESNGWLYKTTAALTLVPCMEIIARILQKPPADEECVLLAMAVLGQIYPFRRQRDGQMPAAGWGEINLQRRDQLREILHRNIRAIIIASVEAGPCKNR